MITKVLQQRIASQTEGKKILLIGSSGNIGGRGLKLLTDCGKAASIAAFDKKPPREATLPHYVKVISGNDAEITNPDSVHAAVKGNDTVLCAVGVPRFTPPGEKKLTPYEIEENGMKNIVASSKQEGIKHIIYISALGVARGAKIPSFHHAHLAKRNAEKILIDSGINYTILRPSGYHFDFRDLMASAISDRYKVVENGNARVQPIDQQDMATILVASIGNTKAINQIIAIGGPEIFSYQDLAKLFGKILKKDVQITSMTPLQFKKEFFNSDVILFRVTSDSILEKAELARQKEIYQGIELERLGDYLNNADDPMLKAYFQKQ